MGTIIYEPDQPFLKEAEEEALNNIVRAMSRPEQKVVAANLRTSIMEDELKKRRMELGGRDRKYADLARSYDPIWNA